MRRRTKIVCTLGPATSDLDTIQNLVRAGMDVARLNLSHGDHSIHGRLIQFVRQAGEREGKVVPILLDLQGPKIRVGDMSGGSVTLVEGSKTVLTNRPIDLSTSELMHVGYPTLCEDVQVGNAILLDDGKIELKILCVGDGDIQAEVVSGGKLSSRKGVNLPNIKTTTPSLTQKDLTDLQFGLDNAVDIIALSFVRDESDIDGLVTRVRDAKPRPLILAKIEKPEAVQRIDPIIEVADGVMVARGDLGIEMQLSKVPGTQKHIIRKCLSAAKPVITATQMLESMIENASPTRAEVSDVANAVWDGSDAVMLSGETAVGKYPVQCVELMATIIQEAEDNREFHILSSQNRRGSELTEAVSKIACDIAEQVSACAIACLTASGRTARFIASHRPDLPIFAFTDDESIVGQIGLTWGTKGFYIPFQPDTDRGIALVHEALMNEGLVRKGDTVVITAGMPLPAKGRTNMVHVSQV